MEKLQKYNKKKLLEKIDFLTLLSSKYPNMSSASSEIINLNAILSLPKGTEHFLSDIHGEYEMFTRIINSASGVVKRKITEIYGETLSETDINQLATLIYFPEQKLKSLSKILTDKESWYKKTIIRLIEVSKSASTKFTRSKMRKYLPTEFAYIIEELMYDDRSSNKDEFYKKIINTIIEVEKADEFIISLSRLIRKIVIDRLHIIGDIFDRGPFPDKVMNKLINHHSVDIQWGNHDVLWIGAAMGVEANIANLLRIAIRYDNCSTIERGYGISLTALMSFALKAYKDDKCDIFKVKINKKHQSESSFDVNILKKMHKAITIIQLKLEGQTIKNNPSFKMEHRLHLDKIVGDTITIDNSIYRLRDSNFPTIDPTDPYKLTEDENNLVAILQKNFLASEKLQEHVNFLINNGSMYLCYNSNLLYHGCIPLEPNGDFSEFSINYKKYKGKDLLDKFDEIVRTCFYNRSSIDRDYLWYLWCGEYSPLFGKKQMRTFERFFIEDESLHKEHTNSYYDLRDKEEIIDNILIEFGLNTHDSYIVNGHVPVKVLDGETPTFANNKLIVIDGGLSKAYQSVTGIAGYTLIYNSYNILLVAHEQFNETDIDTDRDIISKQIFLQDNNHRKRVSETETGKKIEKEISQLNMLLEAYKFGLIKERH